MSGVATLDGSLEVSWVDGFSASLGDIFAFLTTLGGLEGGFASMVLPELGGGLEWSYGQTDDSACLTVVSAIPEPTSLGTAAGAMVLAFVVICLRLPACRAR